ncbi:MAG: hypothetical protein HUJ57_01795 [Erysipelotrichaceae bacterium]|nr:hypothetical protein [Erysipelotrichaceae bacterium]
MECKDCKLAETCLIESLQDAGCDEAFIERFRTLQASDKEDEMKQMLQCHRARLVCQIHELQKLIDVSDYLLGSLKKCRKERE